MKLTEQQKRELQGDLVALQLFTILQVLALLGFVGLLFVGKVAESVWSLVASFAFHAFKPGTPSGLDREE